MSKFRIVEPEYIEIDTAVYEDSEASEVFFMTKEEEAALIGKRVCMFNMGKIPKVPVIDDDYDFFRLAQREIRERLTPLIVVREYPNGDVKRIPVSSFETEKYVIDYD